MTSEQQAVLDSKHRQRVIIAGAGSGKTTTLIADVAQTMQATTDPAGVVVITFTNAAADEFRARLERKDCPMPGFVGTLHSWCLAMLNRHGHAIGYKAPVSMIDEANEERLIKETLDSIKAAKKWTVSMVRTWKATGGIQNPAAIAAKSYMQQLRAASCVDYDSCLFECLRLIQGGHVPPLAALYVDEYQDSGPWDHAIYQAVMATRKFVVGDPRQSVYAFRGGLVRNIIELAESEHWQTHQLSVNFRCPTLVIDGANALIQEQAAARVARRMEPGPSAPVGKIHVQESATPFAEAGDIAGRLRETEAMETAVLVRFNAQIPIIVEALKSEGFAVAAHDKNERQWLPLAISALNAIANPESELAAFTWLWHQFGDELAILRGNAARAGRSTVREAFATLALTNRPPEEQLGGMRLPPEAFAAIVAAWPPGAVLSQVIARVQEDAKPPTPPAGAVYVGTVHSYKGREADRVILAGMADQITPGKKSGEDEEEERRLFYVAATRPRRELWIYSPRQYTPPFGKHYEPAQPSRFATPFFPPF